MNSRLRNIITAVLTFGGGTALLCILAFIHINQGSVSISVGTIIDAIVAPEDNLEHHTVRMLRLPRAVMGIIAGGALAVSGAVLQTVTKTRFPRLVRSVFIPGPILPWC